MILLLPLAVRDSEALPRRRRSLPAMSKRTLSRDETPVKKADYYGACRYRRLTPDVASKGVKSVNVELTFAEALKLGLALDSCLFALNEYKRSTTKSREMGVVLSIKTDNSTMAVVESTLRGEVAD